MGEINLVNMREWNLEAVAASATIPPHVIAAAGTVKRYVAPANGRLKALVLKVATPPTGTGGDHTQGLKIDKRGISGGVTAVNIAAEIKLKDDTTTPDILRAQDDRIVMTGLAGNTLEEGEIFELVATESGSEAGNDSAFNIVECIFEASSHLDGTQQPGLSSVA